ncbi:alpha/beta hydrolase family protein [Roseateles koreensis]|uniref:Acetylhydrolase n=1 Tax=Roseateles koreensis TaxID=2987526 RepID=A0ABT5KMW8_9BURK|nr:hypothetical protein [Roseateles koreensis]MDC8784182.1 hypothetical protein [Roseateles koreensis]
MASHRQGWRLVLVAAMVATLALSACKTTPKASETNHTQALAQIEGTAPAAPELSDWAKAAVAEGVQVHDLDWRDASRQRDVPVRLYWPAQAQAGQKVPLVVFSHGIGSSRRGYSYLGAYFASQGYASLHVQHVGSDRQVWMGNPLQLVSRLQAAAQEGEALNRVADVKFALDQLLQTEYAPAIDTERIAAAGHSYGANTTLLLAGAQVERHGHRLDLHEPRIKAAIIISAPPFYGEPELPKIIGPIAIPTLHITATDDVIRIPGYYSAAQDRLDLFEAANPSAPKMLAVFEGGSHSMFTDRGLTGGVSLNPRAKQATKELAVAFMNQALNGQAEGLQRWGDQYQDILARWQSPFGHLPTPAMAQGHGGPVVLTGAKALTLSPVSPGS